MRFGTFTIITNIIDVCCVILTINIYNTTTRSTLSNVSTIIVIAVFVFPPYCLIGKLNLACVKNPFFEYESIIRNKN